MSSVDGTLSEPENRPPSVSALRGWAWTTLGAGGLTAVVPIFDGADPIVTGGFSTVVMLFAMLLPLFWGVLDPTEPLRQGVIVGSASFIGGFFLLVTATVVFFKRSLGEFIELGPGVAPLIATVISACVVAALGLSSRVGVGGDKLGEGLRWVGGLAGAAITIGIMLPPSDSGLTVKDLNFSFDDGLLQISWIVFLAVAGGTAVIGFVDGSRWGIGVAAAGGLPVAWIVANALFELERPAGQELGISGVLRQEVHPLLVIAVIGGGIAVIAAYRSDTASPPAITDVPEEIANGENLAERAGPLEACPLDESLEGSESDESSLDDRADGTCSAAAVDPRVVRPSDDPEATPELAEFGLRSMRTSGEQSSAGTVDEPDLLERTVTAGSAPFGPVVTFSDGRRHVVLGTLIIGRDPASLPTDDYPILVAMGDEDRRVSKTHLAVGRSDAGQLWVEDRHSTNGVLVTPEDDTAFALDPGRRTGIEPGTTLLFGETTAHIAGS